MNKLYLTIWAIMIKFVKRIGAAKQVSSITFKFNQEKAVEVILYLTQKLPIHNLYRVCKLLYLADKFSLQNYGRFIFGESYVAMEGGGTPSNAYNLLKGLRNASTNDLKIDGNNVIALRNSNLDYLSKSDIECLDTIIAQYSRNWTAMRNDAHDVAQQKAWNSRGAKKSVPMPVESIAKMLDDSGDLIKYLEHSG